MKRIKWKNVFMLMIMIIFSGVLLHDLILILKGATITSFGIVTEIFMIASIIYIYDELFWEVD